MAMDEIMLRMLQLSAKGYGCSQILMKLALELRDEENPALVRAMAGPGYGCGSSAATCGALVGGCCVLALYTGTDAEAELGSAVLRPMQAALTDWFEERVGGEDGGEVRFESHGTRFESRLLCVEETGGWCEPSGFVLDIR